MKKTLSRSSLIFTFIITLFFISGCEDTSTISSDKYTTISPVTVQVDDVVEIFSLSCGHCKNLENVLQRIKDTTTIEFQKTHVVFSEDTLRFAYLFYAAETQFKGNDTQHFEFMGKLFELIQTDFDKLSSEDKTRKIGVLFQAYNMQSPQTLNEAQYMAIQKQTNLAQDLSEELNVSSVPAILVKGKYLINMNGHKNAEELAETINFLLKK